MFSKILTGFIATSMIFGAVAFAAPAKSVENFIQDKVTESKLTGEAREKYEKELRKDVVEALRRSNKVTEAELERIGKKATDYTVTKEVNARERGMLTILKKDGDFNIKISKIEAVQKNSSNSFEIMMNAREANGKPVANEAEVRKAQGTEAKFTDISKTFGKLGEEVEVAIRKTHGEKSYSNRIETARILARRVNNMAARTKTYTAEQVSEFRTSMAKLLIAEAKSVEVLGESVMGAEKPVSEACAGMAPEALDNLSRFIQGGAIEGTEKVSYLKGMGRAASERFKQKLEEGIERVCALQASPCGLLGRKIGEACGLVKSGKAI